ncbi:propanediol utilization protein [Marivita sp. S0852]|uniref:propanediol utilization protein n=1 Tax=Marivita sp. S0852 TaxID=3373893 RepID=UPI003981D350
MIRIAGHFGELMQGTMGPDGPVALVTLPCPVLGVAARHISGIGFDLDATSQALVSADKAQALLKRLDLSLTGRIELRAEMPLGGGAGASTAALVALAKLAGYRGTPRRLAAACIAIEGASDPVMFSQPHHQLWASRCGQKLADLPQLPRFEVIGGFYGDPLRTDATDTRFPDIAARVPQWIAAAQAGDLPALARLASQSAARTLDLRGPRPDPTADLARQLGALGYVIAHTGSARGLIFAPGMVPLDWRSVLERAGLRDTLRFTAGGPE